MPRNIRGDWDRYAQFLANLLQAFVYLGDDFMQSVGFLLFRCMSVRKYREQIRVVLAVILLNKFNCLWN